VKFLSLSNSSILFFVDDEDYPRCQKETWSLFGELRKQIHNSFQVVLSNFILRQTDVMFDHKDRNFLNNQKGNFRECNQHQNRANASKSTKRQFSSKYKGVSYCMRDDCWRAKIQVNGKHITLGTHLTEISAVKAYNRAAKIYFGEFAALNKVTK